ncbi:MAG TPA: tetratricopeptide repeat protein, partial [Opitutaceae bacterium]|nr:tetratricopeptide repeat protein [Opitutaceae bacterium]
RPTLFAACALNLIFPAEHVVGNSTGPIQYFYAALQNPLPTGKEAAFYYNQYALILMQQKRMKEALLVLNISIELNPGQAETYVNRTAVYAGLGQLGEALADADHALALNPGLPSAWRNRGLLRSARGDFAGAFADFDQALRCAPPGWAQRAEVLSAMTKLRSKMAAAH